MCDWTRMVEQEIRSAVVGVDRVERIRHGVTGRLRPRARGTRGEIQELHADGARGKTDHDVGGIGLRVPPVEFYVQGVAEHDGRPETKSRTRRSDVLRGAEDPSGGWRAAAGWIRVRDEGSADGNPRARPVVAAGWHLDAPAAADVDHGRSQTRRNPRGG